MAIAGLTSHGRQASEVHILFMKAEDDAMYVPPPEDDPRSSHAWRPAPQPGNSTAAVAPTDPEEAEQAADAQPSPTAASDEELGAAWAVHEPWEVRKDPNSGHPYYFNKVTKKSEWTKPEPDNDGGAAQHQAEQAGQPAADGGGPADPFGGGDPGGKPVDDPFGAAIAAGVSSPAKPVEDPFGAALERVGSSPGQKDPFGGAAPAGAAPVEYPFGAALASSPRGGDPAAKRQRAETPPERVD